MFTFADGSNDDVRADYGKHNVKVLAASDEGDVDFLVYGYMNRGTYEGRWEWYFTIMMKTVIQYRKNSLCLFQKDMTS